MKNVKFNKYTVDTLSTTTIRTFDGGIVWA